MTDLKERAVRCTDHWWRSYELKIEPSFSITCGGISLLVDLPLVFKLSLP
jgi:hypothetical protein